MTHCALVVSLAALVVTACGGTDGPKTEEPAPPPGDGEARADNEAAGDPAGEASIDFVMSADGIRVGAETLGSGPSLALIEQVFGKADRVEEKINRLHVYEELGLVVYEPYNGVVTAITIYLSPEDFSFVPSQMYPGTVHLAGTAVDGETAFDDVGAIAGATFDASWGQYDYEGSGYSLLISGEGGKVARVAIQFEGGAEAVATTHPMEAACEKGDADACTQVSLAFSEGIGVAVDHHKSFAYATKACDLDQAMSCFMLGMKYAQGEGVAADEVRAREALEKACKLGNGLACQAIGN